MKRLLALVLLCLSLLPVLPVLAQKTPHKGDAPSADEIARRVNEATAQGGSAEEVAERIRGALEGTGYRLQGIDGNTDPRNGSERILSYDIDVRINADNTLDVTETIRVVAQGIQIRRGLYRDFPTRYTDRYGNRVVVGFDVVGLQRDGKPEPWFTESLSNGVRVNFGNDDFLTVPATYTYTLNYRTNRQLGFFKDHDELYWNAIGTGWDFPIERASVTVRLPQPVPVAEMKAEGYTGPQGSKGQHYAATLPEPGVARWTLTEPLRKWEGLTIVLSFPKGILTPPTTMDNARWFLRDNLSILIALATLLLIFSYLFFRWWQVGRDPDPGVIVARYEPPAGYSSAALRFIVHKNTDTRCFTADILALAIHGKLRISSRRKPMGMGTEWTLERTSALDPDTPPSQRALYEQLFAKGSILTVDTAHRTTFMQAQLDQSKVMEQAYAGRMFKRNGTPIGYALLAGIVGLVTAALVPHAPSGTAAVMAAGFALFILLVAFGFLLPAPTPEGRKLLDEIDGLKLYLGVAERDDLARLQAPSLDAGRFESLLPFAVALDVEEAWTKKFTAAVGDAVAQQVTSNLSWYQGSGIDSLAQFSSSLSSGLSSSIASASSPPGSSSGGGGGGSSGGGGGGGGGGGR